MSHRFVPSTKGPSHSLAGAKKLPDYGDEAFAQPDAKLASGPAAASPAFHDVDPHHCFAGSDHDVVVDAPDDFAEDEDRRGDSNGRRLDGEANCAVRESHPSRQDVVVKRKDREDELSDGGSPYCFNAGSGGGKKPRLSAAAVDYRKDREEWSDSAIACLLDAYTDKYVQLNRGNLRGRDWEDVATVVSERCDKHKAGKSVEQCKNKVDNLKKRYKAERQRLTTGNLSVSHWPWFKKMEQIVGSSSSSPYAKSISEDDKSIVAAGDGSSTSAMLRQSKRSLFLPLLKLLFLRPLPLTKNNIY